MKVVITECTYVDFSIEQEICSRNDFQLEILQCESEEELIKMAQDADALIVQYLKIGEKTLSKLKCCKVIVRSGVGIDNIDLEAAKKHGIPVCNVPDYGIDEVADHTISMILSLSRQLTYFDNSIRNGNWPAEGQTPIESFNKMNFVSIGAGRIGRVVLTKMHALKFNCFAFDPYLSEEVLENMNVKKISLEKAYTSADIISLHLPHNRKTHHLISKQSLQLMKTTAILVNTSRGALIDTHALSIALNENIIAAAGLDVFEEEPIPTGHPILNAKNVLLSPHIAYHSVSSIKRLQQLGAEEVERALNNLPLRCRVI